MTFVTTGFVEAELKRKSSTQVLQEHGKKRVAPGFTVADYVKIGEFFLNAGDYPNNKTVACGY
jgi:hypothetical protein